MKEEKIVIMTPEECAVCGEEFLCSEIILEPICGLCSDEVKRGEEDV